MALLRTCELIHRGKFHTRSRERAIRGGHLDRGDRREQHGDRREQYGDRREQYGDRREHGDHRGGHNQLCGMNKNHRDGRLVQHRLRVSRDGHNGDRHGGRRDDHNGHGHRHNGDRHDGHNGVLHGGLVHERELPQLHVDGHKNSDGLL